MINTKLLFYIFPFQPVPDSKLARKREDRLRKATAEREEANFRAAHAHAVAQNEAAQKAAVQVFHRIEVIVIIKNGTIHKEGVENIEIF